MIKRTTTAPSWMMEAKQDLGSAITIDMKDDNDDESNAGDRKDDDNVMSGQDEQPPEMTTIKTLKAATQPCESPMEMDKREAQRQHRKKCLLAVHPRRIKG